MLVGQKIALDPTNKQRTQFARAAGVARFAWNWALAEWRRQHDARKLDPSLPAPSEMSLRRLFDSIKREQFPWVFDVTKCAPQESIINLGMAFRRFFERRDGFPKFKKRGSRASFCVANEGRLFTISGRRIKLAKIGWVRMREPVRFAGKLKRATVFREGERWFVGLLIETDDVKPVEHPGDVVGIDLGVKTLATLSTGEVIQGPKAHTALLRKLRRADRALSRKKKGSRNAEKARRRRARVHKRIANVREDAAQKATTKIAKGFRRIVVEDLNVRGMRRNRAVSRVVSDAAFGRFRVMLEYKAKFYGAAIIVAGRYFPSSKTCSCCGVVKATLALSERTFRCDCGFEADRDLNAALNLEKLAASSAVTACGEERAGAVRKPRVKRSSAKQEPDSVSDLGRARIGFGERTSPSTRIATGENDVEIAQKIAGE